MIFTKSPLDFTGQLGLLYYISGRQGSKKVFLGVFDVSPLLRLMSFREALLSLARPPPAARSAEKGRVLQTTS